MDVWSANVRHVTLERRRWRAQRPKPLNSHTCGCSHIPLQVYRGSRFNDLFTAYEPLSTRPLLVTEFGVDAFDSRPFPMEEDQTTQVRRRRPARAGRLHTPIAPRASRISDAGHTAPPARTGRFHERLASHVPRTASAAFFSDGRHTAPPASALSSQAEWLGGLVSELEANSVGCAAPCGSPDSASHRIPLRFLLPYCPARGLRAPPDSRKPAVALG